MSIERTARASGIDLLRGIVMVVMALDHTREYFHINAFFEDPLDFTKTTPVLFLTRWITHFCAPTFVLLAGMSARLSGSRKPDSEHSTFLITRGLWLILLEVTIVNFGLWFNLSYSQTLLQVIWAIGFSMAVLGLMVRLPFPTTIPALAIILIFGHNLLDNVSAPEGSVLAVLKTLLFQPGVLPVGEGKIVISGYPALPWTGILLAGYSLGSLYFRSVSVIRRKRILLWTGVGAVAGFVLLRLLNSYGDPSPWSRQSTGIFTFLSFLNTTKYPPSLLFTLMTIGPALILLSVFEGKTSFLSVYGRVPLFYFIVHFYLIHLLSVVFMLISGISWSDIHFTNGTGGVVQNQGVSLGWVYVVWIAIVASLYFPCKGYAGFKSRQTSRLWSYL